MSVSITQERPDSPAASALIAELDDLLNGLYPSESRHGYSVDKLLRQGVAFFVVWVDGNPAGCGGVQIFGTEYGELKRMYVRPEFRGQGLGKKLVEHLSKYVRQQGISKLRLETGIHQAEAIGLYEKSGVSADFTVWGLFRRSAESVLREEYRIRQAGRLPHNACRTKPAPHSLPHN